MLLIVSFLFGCTFTYLITVLSSAVTASKILEEAMATYAVMLTKSYESSLYQIETIILKGKIEGRDADKIRTINHDEFEKFANKQIKGIISMIPISHTNIIKYNDFDTMKKYIEQKHRSKNVELYKKR